MNDIYDLVIIGAGPSGLSLAQCMRKSYKKILIVEKSNTIGGCHKVVRNNLRFTEHGPRIYSNSYKNFQTLLKDMGTTFEEQFIPYNFSFSEIGGQTVFSTLTFKELVSFGFAFFLLILNNNYGKNTTLEKFMIQSNFNEKSKDMINRLCRLTDGAGADRYTLNEFLQIFNQQYFYKLYQPKLPNDQGFLKIWEQFLKNSGIEIKLNTEVKNLKLNSENKIESIILNNDTEIKGNNFILAMPPQSFITILKNSDNIIKNSLINFENLEKFVEYTKYNDYICITFHWNKKINLPKVYGFPRSEWGIVFIVLSDYMNLDNDISKTLISCAISITDVISTRTKKTANQYGPDDEQQLILETFEQLKEAFPNLETPDKSILYSGMSYNQDEKKWVSSDEAFVTTSNQNFLPFKGIIPNLYNLGTHNGKQFYKFTSLEAAVTNGIYLSHILDPKLKKIYKIKEFFTFRDMIHVIFYIILY